jgi:hypothetical protein
MNIFMSNRSEKIRIRIGTRTLWMRIRQNKTDSTGAESNTGFRAETELDYFYEAPDPDKKWTFPLYLGERETLVEGEDVGIVRDDVLRIAAGVAEGARHEDPVPHLQAGHAAPHLLHETRRIWQIVRNKCLSIDQFLQKIKL